MDIELVNYFIAQVYKYYPVGFVHFIPSYKGHLEMQNIVKNKIERECADINSVSYQFVKSIKDNLPLLEIENCNYFMFPNYVVVIQLLPVHEGRILHRSHFEICISQLCDYYTYYLIDDFKLEGFYEEKLPSRFTVFSSEQSQNRLGDLIPTVVDSIHKYFPDKKYVSYGFLTDHTVYGAVPYNEEPYEIYSIQTKHNFFELLFNPNYNFGLPQKNLR